MTYLEALCEAITVLATSWRRIPGQWTALLDGRVRRAPLRLAGLLYLVIAPVLVPAAPFLAWAILVDERRSAYAESRARAEMDAAYRGHRQTITPKETPHA